MRVLKLRAVDLHYSAGVAVQRLRRGFRDARLAGASRSGEEEIPNRASRRIQAGHVHLVNRDHGTNSLFLTNNTTTEHLFEDGRLTTPASRIQCDWRNHPHTATSRKRTLHFSYQARTGTAAALTFVDETVNPESAEETFMWLQAHV